MDYDYQQAVEVLRAWLRKPKWITDDARVNVARRDLTLACLALDVPDAIIKSKMPTFLAPTVVHFHWASPEEPFPPHPEPNLYLLDPAPPDDSRARQEAWMRRETDRMTEAFEQLGLKLASRAFEKLALKRAWPSRARELEGPTKLVVDAPTRLIAAARKIVLDDAYGDIVKDLLPRATEKERSRLKNIFTVVVHEIRSAACLLAPGTEGPEEPRITYPASAHDLHAVYLSIDADSPTRLGRLLRNSVVYSDSEADYLEKTLRFYAARRSGSPDFAGPDELVFSPIDEKRKR
jgi:hypothetical protein